MPATTVPFVGIWQRHTFTNNNALAGRGNAVPAVPLPQRCAFQTNEAARVIIAVGVNLAIHDSTICAERGQLIAAAVAIGSLAAWRVS